MASTSRGGLQHGKRDFERHITNPQRPARHSRLPAPLTAMLSRLIFRDRCRLPWGRGIHRHRRPRPRCSLRPGRRGRASQCRPVSYVAFKTGFSASEGTQRAGRHINADATLSIRLLPRVFDGEAPVWPWMKDARRGKPVGDQLRHPIPREAVFLAAPPKRTTPEVGHVMPER